MEVDEATGVFLQVVHPNSRRVALAKTYPIDRPLVAEELVRTLRSLSNGSVALLASYVSAVGKESNGQVTMHTSYQRLLSIFHMYIQLINSKTLYLHPSFPHYCQKKKK